ncbi:MAG TPA: hypothetical protein PLU24_02715 [Candidatus Omnitrophota bacterium]|nr:hypothetical protein [Candidatus Omnitrophota bacterium]
MKNTYFWAIIAVLSGATVFGMYKSIELTAKNLALRGSMHALEAELLTTQKSLASTKKVLGESYLKNAELEGRLIAMDAKVAQQARDIRKHLSKISALSAKLQETAKANAFFSARNQEIAHELFNEKLAADEMRGKLSSITELKKAIKALRSKVKTAVREERLKPAMQLTEPADEVNKAGISRPKKLTKSIDILDGNGGYLVKEGKSTYTGWIDVDVVASGPVVISQ